MKYANEHLQFQAVIDRFAIIYKIFGLRNVIAYVLIFVFPVSVAYAYVSTNVPLNHWSYEDIDRLIGMDLINSALSGTRPYARLEMAQLVGEALGKYTKNNEENENIRSILSRLKKEFNDELISLKVIDGYSPTTFIKPIDNVFLKYFHSSRATFIENDEGERFAAGSNFRLKLSSRGKLWNHFGFFIQPELKVQRDEGDWDLEADIRKGYGKLELFNIEIEGGRDSLWWGPGRHGSLFVTNNARSYESLIKVSNARPILLPWIFEYLGPFKITLFGAELEKDRHISKAKLLGQRINFKPHPLFEIGFMRTYTWGGKEEKETVAEFWEPFKSMWAASSDKNNYLDGLDISLKIPHMDCLIPLAKTLTVYGELGSDDETGRYMHEKQMGYLAGGYFGDLFLGGKTDLRIEYAVNNPHGDKYWYSHDYYASGYTYKGRIIGHHMGTNAKDIYIRITHYITKDWLVKIDFDREWKTSSANTGLSAVTQLKDQWTIDLSYLGFSDIRLQVNYRFENIKNSGFDNDKAQENHIGGIETMYTF